MKSSSRHVLAFGAVCLAGLAWSLAGHGQDEKEKPAEGDRPSSGPKRAYIGEFACAQCHNRSEPLQSKEYPPLSRCTECGIWETLDKHKHAYLALTEERGQQMSRLLHTDVTKDAHCLSCHAVVTPAKDEQDPSFKIAEGVSCAVCHGEYEDWVDQHGSALQRKRERWRHYTREKKEKDYGMIDLWDPARRTQKCVSCHVGNTAEGKVVTHDMYAAGHPPIPGIEIASFSEQMPRHWQYIKEKEPEVQKLLGYQPGSQKFEQTQLVVVSSIAALRDSLNLIGTQAEKCGDEGGLDLALFDCYACHHDLKSPSWRQQRGYVGKPGRPQMRPWPTALVKLAMSEVGKKDEAARKLDDSLKLLYQAFEARPFGDCKKVTGAAGDLVHDLDQLLADLLKPENKYDDATAGRLLHKLCLIDDKEIPDYDSARQIAWAFEIIYSEWKPNKEERDPKVLDVIKAMKKQLALDLPAGQEKNIVAELPESLKTLNDYSPEEFKKNLHELSKLLGHDQKEADKPAAGASQDRPLALPARFGKG